MQESSKVPRAKSRKKPLPNLSLQLLLLEYLLYEYKHCLSIINCRLIPIKITYLRHILPPLATTVILYHRRETMKNRPVPIPGHKAMCQPVGKIRHSKTEVIQGGHVFIIKSQIFRKPFEIGNGKTENRIRLSFYCVVFQCHTKQAVTQCKIQGVKFGF